jgi:hypothetical protein
MRMTLLKSARYVKTYLPNDVPKTYMDKTVYYHIFRIVFMHPAVLKNKWK